MSTSLIDPRRKVCHNCGFVTDDPELIYCIICGYGPLIAEGQLPPAKPWVCPRCGTLSSNRQHCENCRHPSSVMLENRHFDDFAHGSGGQETMEYLIPDHLVIREEKIFSRNGRKEARYTMKIPEDVIAIEDVRQYIWRNYAKFTEE